MSPPADAANQAAISQAMRENQLEEHYRSYVEELLARRDDAWRTCCQRDCEPCMRQLMRVVDRARELGAEPLPARAAESLTCVS